MAALLETVKFHTLVYTNMERKQRTKKPELTEEEVAKEVENFIGKNKKWTLKESHMVISDLDGVAGYPFPVRKNDTMIGALLRKYPKWWLLELGGCPLPGFDVIYDLDAWFDGQNKPIQIAFKVKHPFNALTDEESDKMVEILSRVHDVEHKKRDRVRPKPNLDAVKKINDGGIRPS